MSEHTIKLTVNGNVRAASAPARLSLADFLRDHLDVTSTHIGCEQGACGACTVLVDGRAVRSCLMLAVQAQGANVRTLEGVASADGQLHPLQQAFIDKHGMQCGFCTPGFVMTMLGLLEEHPDADERQIREALGGVLCRCTGYVKVVEAVEDAVRIMRQNRVGTG